MHRSFVRCVGGRTSTSSAIRRTASRRQLDSQGAVLRVWDCDLRHTRHQPHRTEPTILRKPLLKATLPKRQVTAVDVREITFQPSQQTGRHKHPCPVIGYIAEGAAVLQIEGQCPQQLPSGSAFYEPADVIITRFDNASATAPMKFIAQYLLNGDQALIEML